MTNPDQPEKKEPCRMCDGVGGAIEGCPCSRCEGARRHDRHTASDAPKTMGEGRFDGNDAEFLKAIDGMDANPDDVQRFLSIISSLSQERDEMKEKQQQVIDDALAWLSDGLKYACARKSEEAYKCMHMAENVLRMAYAKAGKGAS